MRILYVGALWHGGTCLQRLVALRDLGHWVVGIDTEPPQVRANQALLPYRALGRLYRAGVSFLRRPDLARVNQQIVHAMDSEAYDVLWLDKGLTIERATLLEVRSLQPNCRVVGYSPDDMYQRHNQSPQFLDHLSLYDVFFTTKSYNVAELRQLGSRRVEFVRNAYDPHTHKPWSLSGDEKRYLGGPVGFIGTYERERAMSLTFLARSGVPIRIWGEGWRLYARRNAGLGIDARPLWSDEYAKAICSFDINLNFLRRTNRDLQTTRSVEIPACMGFMLAERTKEHMALFEEGREAEFFESNEEMLDKVRFYISHDKKREMIATAGYERCMKSGYSNHSRLQKMLMMVASL